ncbi:glycosyltransferase [Fulvivirga sp. M361]|uniref:glycosyltransferase n=1 Tax=Fulvivirga sp. M361 TaxID=2594266 RepID=UPI00117B5507|nr:glycosyltransferase [Fulvivirga sp. M361]TRX62134.1 glycosyltransferase [Fulvivirga sp. M361]
MIWVLAGVLIVYLIWMLRVLWAWYSLMRSVKNDIDTDPAVNHFYSIVIPFRNEEHNLRALLASIEANDFPKECYEVILVDDHSEDASNAVIELYLKSSDANLRIFSTDDKKGKKNALNRGIAEANGKVIITTDADCEVAQHWLSSIAYYFEHRQASVVSGAVTFHGESSVFQRMQVQEFATLVGVGAASIYLGKPGMCNGANLAFTKSAFHEVGGYSDNDHLASGDDEFLLHKIAKQHPDGIYFNTQGQSFVSTRALSSLKAFIQQRRRWASKWRYYDDLRNSLLAAFIGVVNIAVILSLLLISFQGYGLIPILLLKAFMEWIFIARVLRFTNKKSTFISFVLLYILYPFYVVYFAVVSNFGGYSWKGRRY